MSNPEDFKKCNSCEIYFSKGNFQKKQSVCTSCRSHKEKEKYTKAKVKERIPYRNQLFKKVLEELEGEQPDMQLYNKQFIPFEKYEEMKTQKDKYSFCECNEIRKLDKETYKYHYDNKLFIDVVMCEEKNENSNSAYIFHVI